MLGEPRRMEWSHDTVGKPGPFWCLHNEGFELVFHGETRNLPNQSSSHVGIFCYLGCNPGEFFRMTWSIKKSLFQEDDKVSLKDSKPQVDTTSW